MMLRFAVLCTKHPGFSEELEWRIMYSPNLQKSRTIEQSVQTIQNTPQIVQAIPLKNSPEEGLFNAAIPDLLDRVIIGPTENAFTISLALEALLGECGVSDPQSRIKISGIPLRHC
jgi:hypothetical protein